MTNQAEKLATEFMAKLTVYAPSKADPIDELHWQEAQGWLASAITQATAELREEVAAQIEANNRLVEHVDRLTTENERLKAQLDELNLTKRYTERNWKRAEKELNTAQAQVAGLVEAITIAKDLPSEINPSNCSEDDVINLNDDCIEAYGVLEAALDDTQATADAYTAKVREEAIRECIEAVYQKRLQVFNGLEYDLIDIDFVVEALQALIGDKKGGA